ncbi:MAG: glutamyl-tRNA reductase, partial [Acidobacteriaceae bacterium]
MRFLVTGLNHKTAPIELRERLAIAREALPDTTRALMGQPGVLEAMILSTCNRVELVVSHNGLEPHLPEFLAEHFSLDRAVLEPHLYRYQDEEAIKHMFRVAASLDSMVVGEAQILGQVKQSWTIAREMGAVKGPLDKLLQGAFTAAKRVRSETEIGSSSVSIASVAVDLARRIFGSLDGKKVLIVGAGKMSELTARHLMQNGADSIMVANRTHERAVKLAEQFMG